MEKDGRLSWGLRLLFLALHLIKGPSSSARTCDCWISFHPRDPLNWTAFTFSFSCPCFRLWDRIKLNLDTAFSYSGGKMYGLIFENFSGYIKVSGLSYSQQRPFIISFKIICVARKMHVLANIENPSFINCWSLRCLHFGNFCIYIYMAGKEA